MGGSLRLGKILGIDIRIHYSWFLIFAFVSYYIYGEFHRENYDFAISLVMGLLASLALFACIVAHELAHSLVAMRNGIPVRSITLFILGGVANISKEAERPKTEMLMAIAGPSCSLALGLAFGAAWLATGGLHEDATAFHGLLFWLATLNLSLGVFNLLPGFPMDGGRVLRAVIWQITKNYRKATRIASVAGQIVGWLIAGAGVGIVIAYFAIGSGPFDIFDGFYFVLLGWFLSSIAASSYRQAAWHEAMQGITAASVMVSDFAVIPPSITLKQLVVDYVLPKRYHTLVVATEGRLLGTITVENIQRVPQNRWDDTTASAVMTPADKVVSIAPEEEAIHIAEKMEEYRLDEIPVVKDGVVVGMVTRQNLIRLMQLRSK
jgi:Zn-dependent protease/CBS domain-containing protein